MKWDAAAGIDAPSFALPAESTHPAAESALLEVHDVAYSYGRLEVLRGATFRAHRGELIGIVGENGTGKSTLMRIVAGLLAPRRGCVRLGARFGYCPQDSQVHPQLTVLQNLEWFRAAYRITDPEAGEALVAQLGLYGSRRAVVETLSGGTRQKLNLAIALMHDPDIILLDEPYQGFDWETYLRFWEVAERLRQEGRAIVVISHLFFERGRFDRLLRLRDGVLLAEEAT